MEQFRDLFAQRESASPKAPSSSSASASASATDKSVTTDKAVVSESSLESMPVKELRRLAEQRGLTGVSDLRKKELLAALRQQITSSPATEKADTVVVERTLDLTEMDDLAEEATILE
jgi:Ulp1 family protease